MMPKRLLLLFLLGCLLAACTLESRPYDDFPPAPTRTRGPSLLTALAGTATPAPSRPAPAADTGLMMPAAVEEADVVRVIDGDTVDVLIAGYEERVRLIGINTPESVDPRRAVECFGLEAAAQLETLLEGQTVYLEADPSQTNRDRYDRLLRFIWLEDNRLVNLEMIADGFASEYTYNMPYAYQDEFRAAEDAARVQDAGLWSPATCNGDY